jgi:hypothetical protein
MKTNFATRVIVKIASRSKAEGDSSLKNELLTLINSRKVNIDRTVFAKTQFEKDELKIAKMKHKAMLRQSK